MKFYTVGLRFTSDRPCLEFWGFEEGKKVKESYPYPFKPYLFIRESDYEKTNVGEQIRNYNPQATFEYGLYQDASTKESVIKVSFSDNRDLTNFLRNSECRTYEGDLGRYPRDLIRRFLIDYKAEIEVINSDRFLYWDIEVDARQGFPDPDKADRRIIAICGVDRHGNKHRFSEDSEIVLIEKFLGILDKYAALVDWYGNSFDWPYIRNRCRILNIPFNWRQIVHVDLRAVYKDILKKKQASYALDYVAKEELGRGKLFDFEKNLEVGEIWNLFEKDRESLLDYCLEDCELVKGIDEKYSGVDILFTMASVSHNRVQDLVIYRGRQYKRAKREISYYNAIDGAVLGEASEEIPRPVWPSIAYGGIDSGYVGPWVYEPVPGVHRNVIVVDFRAMHLSIIDTFNMGIDTFRGDKSGDILAPHGSFVSSPTSIYRRAVQRLRDLRGEFNDKCKSFAPGSDEWKTWDAKQFGVKQLTLSLYGVFGYSKGRHFKPEIAEDITLLCRFLQDLSKAEIEKLGFQVIYGDTDSMFVKAPEHFDGNILDLAKDLSKRVTQNMEEVLQKAFKVEDFHVELGVDKIYSHLYFSKAKKRYFGILMWKGSWCCIIDAVGLEMIRRDWPKAAQKFQEELLKRKLVGESNDNLVRFSKETKRLLYEGEFDDKLCIYKGISRALSEYTTDQQHVRVAKMLISKGVNVRVGDKVGYVIIGERKNDLLPVYGPKLNIPRSGYVYIWDHYFRPLIDRADVDFEGLRKMTDYM